MEHLEFWHLILKCHEGVWSQYKGIAVIELDGKVYGAVSGYFDGTLDKERVFEVKYYHTILDENEYDSLKGRGRKQTNEPG